jgi:hypothetical protein
MRTKLTIMATILVLDLAAVAVGVLLVLTLGGWTGVGVAIGLAGLLLLAYRSLGRPWHQRWGATDEEIARALPGDELLPDANVSTRAITIDARPEQVWPWLVQLGYGGPAGTATTGSTTTATPAPAGSSPSCNGWSRATRS